MAPYIEAIDAQQLSYYTVSVTILKFLFLAFRLIIFLHMKTSQQCDVNGWVKWKLQQFNVEHLCFWQSFIQLQWVLKKKMKKKIATSSSIL